MTKRLLTAATKPNTNLVDPKRVDALYQRVSGHIDSARQNVQRSVDTEMVKAYWLIGISWRKNNMAKQGQNMVSPF